jgi:hypothetical protein
VTVHADCAELELMQVYVWVQLNRRCRCRALHAAHSCSKAGAAAALPAVGLVSSLVQCGVLRRPAQLAGSSAGSLIAASFNAGLDMATVEKSMIDFGENCLKNGTRYRYCLRPSAVGKIATTIQ